MPLFGRAKNAILRKREDIKAVEKVEKVVIGVRAQSNQGKILEGSGLILTTEGHAVTLGDLLPKGYDFSFFWEGEKLPFTILKVGLKENLVQIKVEKTNLPTVAFVDSEKIKLGQRVFLVGVIFEGGKTKKIVKFHLTHVNAKLSYCRHNLIYIPNFDVCEFWIPKKFLRHFANK